MGVFTWVLSLFPPILGMESKQVNMARYLSYTREDYLNMDLEEFDFAFQVMLEIIKKEDGTNG